MSARITPMPEPVAPPPPPAETPEQQPTVHVPVDIRSAALTIIAVLALILVLQYAQPMLIPIVLSILISYALDPIVTRLEHLRVPRPLGAGLLLLTFVCAASVLMYELRFEAQAIVRQLPDAARRLRETFDGGPNSQTSAIKDVQKAASEIEKTASAAATPTPPPAGVQRVQVETPPINVTNYVVVGSLSVVTGLAQFVLILFLSFFLLASGDLYRRKLVKIVGPSLTKKKITVQILQDIDQQIERFLIVQVFTSVLVGVASWMAFRWVGLNQPAVWGGLAGIFNSIPYFGPVLVTGGLAIVAFLQFGSLSAVALTAGLALVITSLEGMLLTPWLTSRAARMNAVAVFVGLLFWGWVWNIWGMLLAVPMLMVIKSVCDHVDDFKSFGELLGD
jgi:predicted PurR-regulated permease PerM